MRQFAILLGISLLFLSSVGALAADQPDVEAIRRDIERNGWSFEVDDKFISTLTPEQRLNLRGFNPPPDYQKELDRNLKIFPINKDPLPTNLDWRDVDGITPVKNQADCGSCWAFGATAELEAFIKIYYGVETDLSEQQVVSCNPYGAGCDGGWANAAYFVFQQYGAVQENCMPYVGMDPPEAPCDQDDFKKYGFITGWHSVSNNVEQMKAALQYGPLCTAIDASDEFEAYSSGCYDVPGGWTNHLVLIVGYDDRSCDGNGAWIIKNSWGSDFGVGGYIEVQYGAGSVGTSLTQLDYTAPGISVEIHPDIASAPLLSDDQTVINWETSGGSTPTVDIWFGVDGHCHDYLVAENVPNTGSYDWTVPNLGTNYGSLVVYPSGGTEEGFGLTEDYIQIIGHKTRYVSPAGSNTAPYETIATAAHDINDAVAACTGTDSVLVAGGNYVGSIAVGGMVKLFGGFNEDFSQRDPELFPTSIQSGSTGIRFLEGSLDFGMVDGFTFRGCTGSNSSEPANGRHGGAIYVKNSSPVINNCIFEDNRADPGSGTGYGGAICVVGGQPVVTNCTFTGNIASKGGAVGVFGGADVSVSDCSFTANSCSDSLGVYSGAAIYVNSSELEVMDSSIVNNGGSGSGGGLHVESGVLLLDRVDVRGNRSLGNGGGILAGDSELTLRNLSVTENASQNGSGGGVCTTGSSLAVSNVRFAGNHSAILGGGLYGEGFTGKVENCLVQNNTSATGGGLVVISNDSGVVRNNMVIGNTGGGLMAVGSGMTADGNNVWQNNGEDYVSMTPGAGDFSMDPLFVDPAAGDYGLAQFSPCIDRGAEDPACLDPDGSRADMGLLGGPAADFVAPAMITGADLEDLGGGSWRLNWNAAPEPDITHYVVYRDTTDYFMPSPLKALAMVEYPITTFEDTPGYDCYYLVVAVNEGGYSGGYSEKVATDGGTVSPVGENNLPRNLAIAGVVPNPFNPKTTLSYDVPRSSHVELTVYDIRGRLVRQLVSGPVEAGSHTVVWDGRDRGGQAVAAGVYFARMTDGRSATTAKMVLAK